MTPSTKVLGSAWNLMNSLRSYDRFSSGRRVAALAAIGFLASQGAIEDPQVEETWTDFRNRAIHYGDAQSLEILLQQLSQQIEDQNPGLGRCFSSILTPDILQLGGALPQFVALATANIEPFTRAVDGAFGEWFDVVLDLSGQGRQIGEVTTSRSLARLMANLLDPRPQDAVLDPTCGLGATLIEVALKAPGAKLYGQEVDALSAALATLRLYLLGLSPDIILGDALRAPAQWPGHATRFDRVICDPPFNLSLHGRMDGPLMERFGHLSTGRTEAFFIQHCLDNLAPGGRAVVLLPLGFLARGGGEASYRTELIERGRVEGVVALPGGVIPWTELPIALLVLRGHNEPGTEIRLVDASYLKSLGKRASERLGATQITEIMAFYAGPPHAERSCAVSPDEVLKRHADLQPQHWFAVADDEPIDLGVLYDQALDAEARADAAKVDLDARLALFGLGA